MSKNIFSKFKQRLPFITILLGTIFQLFFLYIHNFQFLLTNTLPDDAFYYFQTARNIVSGLGSTFDGVNIGNGYHPFWMLVLLPIFKFLSNGGVNDLAPIYVALTVAIFMSAGTAYFLYKILSKYLDNKTLISFGIFIYLFNPVVLYNVLNGLETSLLLLLLSIYIYLFVLYDKNIFIFSNKARHLVLLGLVGGLLSLVRLDMTIVVALANLYFLTRREINSFFISSLTSAIIFFTWMIYNFKMFGIYLTSASVTSTFINHRLTYSDNGGESIGLFLKL